MSEGIYFWWGCACAIFIMVLSDSAWTTGRKQV
nr:MAG TPA: hypothetical protein [Caudoviricetes sp.]